MRKKIEETREQQDAKTGTTPIGAPTAPSGKSASLPRTQNQDRQSSVLYSQVRQNFAYMMQNNYAKALVKIGGTSVGVATILYPLEVLRDRAQLDIQSSFKLKDMFKFKFKDINFNNLKSSFKSPVMFNYKTLMPFIQGYINANRMSLGKNTVIAQRDPVSQHVESFIGEKGKENTDPVGNNGRFNYNKYAVPSIAALIITTLDMTFTQYYSNMRVFNTMGKVIELESLKQKFDFMRAGAPLRFVRNYGSTLACLATSTILREPIDAYIPHDTSPYIHNAATSLIASTVIAPGVNAFEWWYRNQMKQFNTQTFKTPSSWQVLKEAVKTSGLKTPLRGLKWTIITNGLAFFAINGISDLLDTYVFTDSKPRKPQVPVPEQPRVHTETKREQPRASQSRNAFFASTSTDTEQRKQAELGSKNGAIEQQGSTNEPPRV
ncbi:Uncharacterised protein [Legionella beliardensis]|uniref:Mitochondrial carrier protein n=1 Tax=Legionella beliardensis TaxID=91822 RepID=A0A378HYV3_9GAMM|nr:hypothetical protein [Legionella beliardensis]STX28079.1 Uncharacterised protein [Legionella beliardensis]